METYRIPEMASKYINYDMFQIYTELPAFPDFRVRLLYAFLANEQQVKQHSELYALAASLVQLGLDTHDLIDTDTEQKKEKAMRSRQLKVLAGDYFSSRFYHLLAREGQIDVIKKLSGAVCEVNRLKMSLYMRMKQLRVTAEEYIHTCVKLKSELFEVFAGMLEERSKLQWPALVQGFAHCEVMVSELERIEETGQFKESWGYWHVLHSGTEEEKRRLQECTEEDMIVHELLIKYDIRKQLVSQLRGAVTHVQSLAGRLESDKLVQELCQIGEAYLRPLPATAPAFNEMR
jgi:heptaprenyl diphosphate synthase